MNGSSNNDIMDATSLLRTHSSKLRITNIKARGGSRWGDAMDTLNRSYPIITLLPSLLNKTELRFVCNTSTFKRHYHLSGKGSIRC